MHNLDKLLVLLLSIAIWIPGEANAPLVEDPIVTVETVVTEPTVTEPPITEPIVTEPVYEDIDIPIFKFAMVEEFKTIYDVENAIAYAKGAVAEYEAVLTGLPLEHPQYDDTFSLKMGTLNYIDECRDVLDAHWASREDRRPVMTHIWRELKERGFSDAVTAGIIGNLIAETGGMGHQDIEWDIKANGYYGFCMWSLKYVPQINGADLDEQIEYLVSSMEKEFNTVYSKSFRKKFGVSNLRYKDFLKIDNPYDAAIAFAVCYERPSAKHVERRGPQAEKAYEYFVTLGSWPWPGK